MSDDKKQSSFSAKVAGAIAGAIGTITIGVLTAQNVPWWLSKVEGIWGGNNKPSNPEQPTSTLSQSPNRKPSSSDGNPPNPTPPKKDPEPDPGVQEIGWNISASGLNLDGKVDQDFKFVCPPNGSVGYVIGTDTYGSGSSICNAAVHAGLITIKAGGKVTIRIRPHPDAYVGTNRHEISSSGGWFGNFGGVAFIFLKSDASPVADLDLREISWGASASGLLLDNLLDQDFKFVCPPNGSVGYVIGTDTYGSGSSICNAAVHAGLITIKAGGKVTIRIRPHPDAYVGTNRHEISSSGGWFGNFGGVAFIFLKSDASPVAH